MRRLALALGLLVISACAPTTTMVNLPPLDDFLVETVGQTSFGGQVFCAYDLLAVEARGEKVEAYAWALCMEYYQEDGSLQGGTGSSLPVALHLQQEGGVYRLTGFELPGNGTQFMPSVERIFPADAIRAMCLGETECYNERAWRLEAEVEAQARAYFGLEQREQERGWITRCRE